MNQIIVIGGNFAGLTSALELKRRLGYSCKVIMISKLPYFLFHPSLLWIPFGKRELEDIAIPLERITSKAQIELICAEATEILPDKRIVKCNDKEFTYDYLIIATGPKWIVNQVDGMGPESNISYFVDFVTAMKTRERLTDFIKNPGPVVIGAAQGLQCIGPAYEFLLSFEKRCRSEGIRNKVDLTFITPEPYLGHLGMDGLTGSHFIMKNLLRVFKINYITNAEIKKVTNDTIILNTAQSLPYKFAVIMPMFEGADVIKNSTGLGNDHAFLPVSEGYQHNTYPNIFGIGSTIDLPSVFNTQVPVGIAQTGYAAIVSAKIAVENIIRLINGNYQLKLKPMTKLSEMCVLDAGDKEVLTFTIPLLKPRMFSLAFPNLIDNSAKIAVEKYFLWKFRHGYSWLPP